MKDYKNILVREIVRVIPSSVETDRETYVNDDVDEQGPSPTNNFHDLFVPLPKRCIVIHYNDVRIEYISYFANHDLIIVQLLEYAVII